MRDRAKIYIILSIAIAFLFLMPTALSIKTTQATNPYDAFLEDIDNLQVPKIRNFGASDNIEVNFEVRKLNEDWESGSIEAAKNDFLEFRVTYTSHRDYDFGIGAQVDLPEVSDSPMFNYVEDSITPELKIFPNDCYADNNEASWAWFLGIPDEEVMTFKAQIVKAGKQTVNVEVIGAYTSEDGIIEDIVTDTIIVTAGKPVSCCFPAGTKILMADGSCKNIEDIKKGDWVKSYNVEYDRYSKWMVVGLGDPKHPVCVINDGLLSATVDHPIYVKKTDGRAGFGAVDVELAKDACRIKEGILSIEVGDKLLTSDGRWIEINSISYQPEVQTYNILSFSGTRTYFANNILVFEEHPPMQYMMRWRLGNIIERLPPKLQNLALSVLMLR
jgi:hypothetical protein